MKKLEEIAKQHYAPVGNNSPEPERDLTECFECEREYYGLDKIDGYYICPDCQKKWEKMRSEIVEHDPWGNLK